MSAKVSSFEKVSLGDYQYLFFLVAWSDYETNRLESLRLDQIRGTLREEEERVERNKIALALLELVGG